MIKNYLTIAWRNLIKHNSFSFINILGLAIGIATCMIIFIYVYNESTFDRYNEKMDRIARVTTIIHSPESDTRMATTPAPLAVVLKQDYPEVESVVRLEQAPQVLKYNNDLIREEAFYKADQNVFSIFSFTFLQGAAAGALQNPSSIVITETIAKKYFGTRSALGKTMTCSGQNLLVTGVVKDRPDNSDIRIEGLLSADYSKVTSWIDEISLYTFVLFGRRPGLKSFEAGLQQINDRYVRPELNPKNDNGYRLGFELEALSDVHFTKGKILDTPKGSRQLNAVFSILAVFILVIALLNYINLSTAKSMERAKEVGIRKVSGAGKFQLMRQFLFESLLLISMAWLLSIVLVEVAVPWFNKLWQIKLSVDRGRGMLFMGAIFFVTLFLAGLYPAFVLSALQPVSILKGSWRGSVKGLLLRKTVTIVQFSIAAALMMGTAVIYYQMKFIRQKDLGYNKDQLLAVYPPEDSVFRSSVDAFRDALRQIPEVRDLTIGSQMQIGGLVLSSTKAAADENGIKSGVKSGKGGGGVVAAGAGGSPGQGNVADAGGSAGPGSGRRRELLCNYFQIDPHYLPVFGIRLAEGRNLSDSFTTDKKEAFLVNEAFVKEMGWKTSAIGRRLEGFERKGRIVGVVKDFYYKSLHNLVEPLVLVYNTNPDMNAINMKIRPRDLPVVKALYAHSFPAVPFDYEFFDEMVSKQYKQDETDMALFNGFTLLAIFVSCLGLYGLVTLVAAQRTKEVGIHKVLGASLNQLLSLLSRDFVRLACWALVIALPAASLLMNRWLDSYAYHIRLTGWLFLIPIVALLGITLAVISREVIKTALVNPAKSLRSD
ncbi:MAG: ABC transporter permease [Puia sp.]|nr:ABC transporter permease [Puia sp.]